MAQSEEEIHQIQQTILQKHFPKVKKLEKKVNELQDKYEQERKKFREVSNRIRGDRDDPWKELPKEMRDEIEAKRQPHQKAADEVYDKKREVQKQIKKIGQKVIELLGKIPGSEYAKYSEMGFLSDRSFFEGYTNTTGPGQYEIKWKRAENYIKSVHLMGAAERLESRYENFPQVPASKLEEGQIIGSGDFGQQNFSFVKVVGKTPSGRDLKAENLSTGERYKIGSVTTSKRDLEFTVVPRDFVKKYEEIKRKYEQVTGQDFG